MNYCIHLKKKILFFFFFLAFMTSTFAQVATTGTEFYVAFGRDNTTATVAYLTPNNVRDTIQFVLRVTTMANANVTLNFTGNPALNTTFSVGAGQIKDYLLTYAQAQVVYCGSSYNTTNSAANMKSIYVTSTAPINLVAFTFAVSNMAEATLVTPVENLGTNYYHVGYNPYNTNSTNYTGFLIVATQNNTKVDFTGIANIPSVTLNKGEVYQYLGTTSALGTKITASNPIAFFHNTSMAGIYAAGSAYRWNYMYEQLPPVEQWGTRFIMPTNNLKAAWLRVFANTYPTNVEIRYTNGQKIPVTLTSGVKYQDIKIDGENVSLRNEGAVYIVSDNPIYASIIHAPYSNATGQTSQPGTAWLPPVDQRVKSALVSPLDVSHKTLWMPIDHYMQIITPTATKNNTTISINGGTPQPVPSSVWITDNIGGSGYSFGLYYFGQSSFTPNIVKLNTTVLLDNPAGLSVLAYGQGNYTSYYYMAGAAARNLSQTYSISGMVSGLPDSICPLPNNGGIPVTYNINGGTQMVVTTEGGGYTIPNVPAAANVVIIPSVQPGYTGFVSPLPNTSMVLSDITGKNIMYTYNPGILVEHAKVFSCHANTEIDILAMMGYDCDRANVIFKMIEQPQFAEEITGLNENRNLPYIHHTAFEGRDCIHFSVSCGLSGKTDTVQLHIYTIACPDNIVAPSCSEPSKKEPLDVRLRSKTRIGDGTKYSDYIAEMDMPLVGDIYGDGNVKILAAVSRDRDPDAESAWLSHGIAIFDGKTGAFEDTISTVPFHLGSGTRAIAKVNGKTKIFIASGGGGAGFEGTDNYVVCYDLKTKQMDWVSSDPYIPAPDQIAANILVADMNADGTPEVIAGNKIFNAATGNMLLDMSTMSGLTYGTGAGFKFYSSLCDHMPYFPAVADMANDGVLEFVAGYNIYKIHIPAKANSTAGSTITLYRTVQAAPGGTLDNVGDGATAVADLDGDGYLDVIVTRYSAGAGEPGYPYVYAYSGKTGVMFGNAINMCKRYLDPDATLHYGQGPSIPVIGDIDGCGHPEIVVSTAHGIRGFKYDPATKALKDIAFYEPLNPHTGMAAMSMFDFNQDGVAELMFHDTDRGRILSYDAANATFVDLLEGSEQLGGCYSNTQNEFTVVADVTGDGRANIVIFGSDQEATSNADLGKGYVYIFEGTPKKPWAPARKVWNQWAYNAVNINNDLTIPKYQANPAIMYIAADSDKIHPYNAFLQQQSLINSDGTYVWTLPNLQWIESPVCVLDGDSAVVTGKIINLGEVGVMSPIYVTFYQDNAIPTKVMQLDSINRDIHAKDTLHFSFTIKNISSYSGIKNMKVGINDKEGDFPYQEVCEPSKYMELHLFPSLNYAQALACQPFTEIDVWSLNRYDCDKNDLAISILEQPANAEPLNFLNANHNLTYIPNPGFLGKDSMEFHVHCVATGEIIDHIKLYITVIPCPGNILDIHCTGKPDGSPWEIDTENFLKSEVVVNSYGQPYVGDVDGCGRNEVVIWNCKAGSRGPADAILIFDDSLKVKYTIDVGGQAGANTSSPDLGLAFAKTDTARTAADIFAVVGNSTGTNSVVKCFEFTGTDWTQKWTTTTGAGGVTYSAAINIGDINNDGNIMLYVDNKIFNAKTGDLLLTLPDIPKGKRDKSEAVMNLLADMDNNGTLEAVAGTCVYKLNITNLSGESNNSYSILAQLPMPNFYDFYADGWTSVADINLDGYLDIIISNNHTNSPQRPGVIVWNIQTDPPSVIGDTIEVHGINKNALASRALAGDVDSCGYPEIVVVSYNTVSCFKLSSDQTKFIQMWERSVNDDSGATSICLFDFEQSGKQEIVYRDEQWLRIIDGETGMDRTAIPCFSPTRWEGPVVADLSGSGYAQIIVTGNDAATDITSSSTQTYLRAYSSANPGVWAPARSVWNQYSYNALNINDDLTVPRYQMNPSTVFPNGKRPYNGFLQQQTFINKNGDYVWALPNLQWVEGPTFILGGDSVIIKASITNLGDAGMIAPVYVTLYQDEAITANIMQLDSINRDINPNDTVQILFTVKNISNYPGIKNIRVGINDKNGDAPFQKVCEPIPFMEVHLVPGKNYAQMFSCNLSTEIDIWNLNHYEGDKNDLGIMVIQQPKHAEPVNYLNSYKNLVYTLKENYVGIDSMEFHVYNTLTNVITDHIKLYIEVIACRDTVWEIWNWDDLSKVMEKQGEGYTNFILMQNIGRPDYPDSYGDGTAGGADKTKQSPYLNNPTESQRRYGWYGYQGWVSSGVAGFDTAINYKAVTGWDATGWIPLGSSTTSTPFTGIFDGQGYEITGLWINSLNNDETGLFGYTENAMIANTGIIIIDVVRGDKWVGGLIGYADSTTISDCYVVGNVKGNSVMGGIVGLMASSEMERCFTTGTITANQAQVGGLVGGFLNGGKITQSYSTAAVNAYEVAGGLVGSASSGEISDCYATGNVTILLYNAGGLVGIAMGEDVEIKNCFATGSVNGYDQIGGLVGFWYGDSMFNCFALNSEINAQQSVGRIIGTYYTATLENNYALACMLVNGKAITGGENDKRNGMDVDAADVTSLTSYFNSWNFTSTWTFDYEYNNPAKKYKVTKTTNLPVLQAFDTDTFKRAEQPPYVWCIPTYKVLGTVFPFTYYEEPEYANLFPMVASLYDTLYLQYGPEIFQYLNPIHTDTVVYYDGTEFVPNTPKYPGYLGRLDNPGEPINWEELGLTPGEKNSAFLLDEEKPESAIGLIKFDNVLAGTYVLMLSRNGYVPRFAKVIINGENTLLGHRELVMGDLNGDYMVDESDLGILKSKISDFGTPLYDPFFDLNGSLRISPATLSLLRVYLNFNYQLYKDTKECFQEFIDNNNQ